MRRGGQLLAFVSQTSPAGKGRWRVMIRSRSIVVLIVAGFALLCATQLASAQEYEFVTKWGSLGTGDGQFRGPWGVATDLAGNVYVADRSNHRIQKFDNGGNFLTKWGSYGGDDGQFRYPWHVAVGAAGNVYVADEQNHRIQKFDSNGTFLTKWGSRGSADGQFRYPTGVATDADGNVYVADCGSRRIQKFDSRGNFLTKWGSYGTGDGQFRYPTGVATDGARNVYVADFDNHRIQKFTGDGDFLTKWGSYGTGDGQFRQPTGVATDAAGNVCVAERGRWWFNHRIQKFDSSGNFLTKWGSYGTRDGQFRAPWGVATDAAGNVYVADTYNHRIQKFAPPATPEVRLAILGGFVMAEVGTGAIYPELEKALRAKIDAALAALQRGNPNHAKVAMNDLKALINQVEAQSGHKIENETALEIMAQANGIIEQLAGDPTATVSAESAADPAVEPLDPVLTVGIDTHPANDPNCVTLGAEGVIPVAIFSSDTFDATQVDPSSVILDGSDGVAVMGIPGDCAAYQEDVNADGLLDLVVQVEVINFDPGVVQEGTAWLAGYTYDGQPIEGTDAITIVPPG